ncbi:MAG: hypothetical protein RI935_704 [Candidatus Parcubacteria bacterium]|jgi:DNA processing protein
MPPSSIIPQSAFESSPLLSRLLTLHQIPKEIFIRGGLPIITIDDYGRSTPRMLTIVGSRKCTSYGKQALREILKGFNKEEVIIVSGLAYGIDETAHSVALEYNLTTIAIPGSGLDEKVLYPSSNRNLAKEIVANSGCLMSEFSDTTKAAKWTFPARNRIMAALSDAVIIIEAEEKSGTLITARQALELGKDIGAVPGEIFSETSKGALSLIRDGATPVTSSSDLRELLHLPTFDTIESTPSLGLSSHEQTLLSLLKEPKQKNSLLTESNLSISEFMSAYTMLEIEGYIQEEFGEVRKIV